VNKRETALGWPASADDEDSIVNAYALEDSTVDYDDVIHVGVFKHESP